MDGDGDKLAGKAPDTVDPVELALQRAREGDNDPAVFRFLAKQEGLVEAQTREARAHAAQLGRERWRDIIITLIGVCVLATGGLFVWDAAQARGVAIEPFRVPPDMEQRRLDGVVVATQVMDQLLTMQAATVSIRAPSTYANNWGDDIGVEIPNTGVTIGDLRSSLRAWFGQQVRLTGEVVKQGDGQVALTVRVGAAPGERFVAPEAEFDALVEQAAESVYRQTQSYRYSIWLRSKGRTDEALEIVDKLANSPSAEDRLWAINTLAARTPDPLEAIALHERGLRLDPTFTPILYNVGILEAGIGREGKALGYLTRFLDAERIVRQQVSAERIDQVMQSARTQHALLSSDMAEACRLGRQELDSTTDVTLRELAELNAASCYYAARDVPAGQQVLADLGLNDPERMRAHVEQLSPDMEIESALALSLGDWAKAYEIAGRVLSEAQAAEFRMFVNRTPLLESNMALAAAHLGRIDEARALVRSLASDCTVCTRTAGIVEALAGNAAGMHEQFAIAVRDAPNLPATYAEYAEALTILGDWQGAIAQIHKAVAGSPNWADPQLTWGDALIGLGEHRAAAGRYREAIRLAPNWGAAWLALGKAHAARNETAQAREAWSRAAALPLSDSDRAEVAGLLSAAR